GATGHLLPVPATACRGSWRAETGRGFGGGPDAPLAGRHGIPAGVVEAAVRGGARGVRPARPRPGPRGTPYRAPYRAPRDLARPLTAGAGHLAAGPSGVVAEHRRCVAGAEGIAAGTGPAPRRALP